MATPAGGSALHSYADSIEDVVTAPDISRSNVVTNDNVVLTIGMHIRDRSSFLEGDAYSIYFDTDSEATTGTDALSGAPPGAEYSIEIAHGKTWLLRWHGSSFDPLTPRKPIATAWLDGLGPVLRVARVDLGDPQSFRLRRTVSGDYDLAPDTGMWWYELSRFALTAGRLSVGQARAGKSVVASMSVERRDFAIPLGEGAVGVRHGSVERHRTDAGRSDGSALSCTWRLATNSAGKEAGRQCPRLHSRASTASGRSAFERG